MRIWTVHPKLLDAKGLVALWREGLLAKAVLDEKTVGYRNHPQLIRFRQQANPAAVINEYLHAVLADAQRRGYRFDASKLNPRTVLPRISETHGQLAYEWQHFLDKIALRAPILHASSIHLEPEPHPLFEVVPGDMKDWEIVSKPNSRI